jgi:hypothetical protein
MTGTACELNDSDKGEKIMTNSRVRLLFAGSLAVVILALNIYAVSSGYATQFYERIDVSLHEPVRPLSLSQDI